MLYHFLVSEVEIKQGLLKVENPKRSCVWFHRAINGLDSDSDNPEALKYTDHCPGGVCLNDGAHPQALLHNLKNEKMKQAVDTENTFTYDVTWTPNGENFFKLLFIIRSIIDLINKSIMCGFIFGLY